LPAATDTLVGKATTDTLTNKTLTGAAMNGTLGATTPSTASVTTFTTSSTITHNGGTANGVTYLNGSKVLTSGTALVFDGTNLGLGVTASSAFGFRQSFTGSGAASQYGIYLDAFSDSSGTGNTIGIRARARTSAAVYTTTSAIDFIADTIGLGAGSTISTAVGFLASDQTVGVTNIGFYSTVSSGTNKYNIYASGTASNYFSGGVNLGSSTDPGTGNLSLTGNIIQGTAAKGINFTANTATAGSTSQLLNWYEEGTWTPSVGGTATYTVQEGFFTRTGRQVTVTGKIQILLIGTGSQSTISGLPFTAASPTNGSYGTGAVGYFANLASSVVSITAFVGTGTKNILFNTLAAAGATATNSPNIMTSTTRIDFSITYFV
jgi:hypothetical protein